MLMEKYPSIFFHNMEAIVSIILQIFFATPTVLKIQEYHSDTCMMHLDQLQASENFDGLHSVS